MKNKKIIVILVGVALISIIGVSFLFFLLNNYNSDLDSSWAIDNNTCILRADYNTIQVGEVQTVTFTAIYKGENSIGIESIPLIRTKDNYIIGYLYYDETYNDEFGGERVYKNQFELKSDIRDIQHYQVELNDNKSTITGIVYTKPYSEEEENERDRIAKEIVDIKSTYQHTGNAKIDAESANQTLENLKNYFDEQIKNGAIRKYEINDSGSTVILSNGIPIISNFNFVPELRSGFDLIETNYNKRTESLNSANNQQKIITLEPFKSDDGENFKEFDDAGKQIEKSHDSYKFTDNLDDDSVTIKVLEELYKYRIIIIDTHGGYTEDFHSVFFITEPVTERFKKDYKEYIENYYIVPSDDGTGVYITYLFFENVYRKNQFNNSLVFLGSCFSMNNIESGNLLIDTLLDKCGVDTIMGFKKQIRVVYSQKMCKTIFDELSKEKKGVYNSISQAVDKAKSKHGNVDNFKDILFYKWLYDEEEISVLKSELILKGNLNFRLSDNLDKYGDTTKLQINLEPFDAFDLTYKELVAKYGSVIDTQESDGTHWWGSRHERGVGTYYYKNVQNDFYHSYTKDDVIIRDDDKLFQLETNVGTLFKNTFQSLSYSDFQDAVGVELGEIFYNDMDGDYSFAFTYKGLAVSVSCDENGTVKNEYGMSIGLFDEEELIQEPAQSPSPIPTPMSTPINEYGNTAGNIANGGFVARQGDWLYIACDAYNNYIVAHNNLSDSRKSTLHKVKIDGTEKTLLLSSSECIYSSINVVGDHIYFVEDFIVSLGIYRMKTDGTEKTKLVSQDKLGQDTYLYVLKDKIYYCTGDASGTSIYSINFDGSDLCKIATNKFYSAKDGTNFAFSREYLVYTKLENYKTCIYRFSLSSSEEIKITEEDNRNANNLIIYKDWIYYISGSPGIITKMKLDGSEKTALSAKDEYSYMFNLSNDIIYYNSVSISESGYSGTSYAYKNNVRRMNLIGEDIHDINDEHNCEFIHIIEDKIFYYSGESFYYSNLDGTNKKSASNYKD